MWAMVAAFVTSSGMGKMDVWVLAVVLPSGRLTDIPCVTGVMCCRFHCACK
jgi:hypothetical protein